MKLIEFLETGVEYFDGEIFSEELEDSSFSFVWNGTSRITETGKRVFKNILNSDIKINRNGDIVLQDKNITQREYDLFLKSCAGYISIKLYNLWFKEEITEVPIQP